MAPSCAAFRSANIASSGSTRICRVPDVECIYAAGDATDFPIKQGGIGSQQADVAAQSIAALAGAPVTPERFNPVIHGMLLTHEKPRYLTAHVTGGHGFSSEITETPAWSPPSKIAAKYLSPYLEAHDRESASQESAGA
jgi:sulfide:quinone oxidoreductase